VASEFVPASIIAAIDPRLEYIGGIIRVSCTSCAFLEVSAWISVRPPSSVMLELGEVDDACCFSTCCSPSTFLQWPSTKCIPWIVFVCLCNSSAVLNSSLHLGHLEQDSGKG
jgi:hypothetical protein